MHAYVCMYVCPNTHSQRTRKIFSPIERHLARESRFICNRIARLCLRALRLNDCQSVRWIYSKICTEVCAVSNCRLSFLLYTNPLKNLKSIFFVTTLSNGSNRFQFINNWQRNFMVKYKSREINEIISWQVEKKFILTQSNSVTGKFHVENLKWKFKDTSELYRLFFIVVHILISYNCVYVYELFYNNCCVCFVNCCVHTIYRWNGLNSLMWDITKLKTVVILETVICHRRIANVDTTNRPPEKYKLRFPRFAEKAFKFRNDSLKSILKLLYNLWRL